MSTVIGVYVMWLWLDRCGLRVRHPFSNVLLRTAMWLPQKEAGSDALIEGGTSIISEKIPMGELSFTKTTKWEDVRRRCHIRKWKRLEADAGKCELWTCWLSGSLLTAAVLSARDGGTHTDSLLVLLHLRGMWDHNVCGSALHFHWIRLLQSPTFFFFFK